MGLPHGQDRFCEEGVLECLKGLMLRGAPIPLGVFLGKVVKWASGFGKVLDELTIEVGESEESVKLSKVLGGRPICDRLYFNGVHSYLSLSDD